jgi:hypothetical protein
MVWQVDIDITDRQLGNKALKELSLMDLPDESKLWPASQVGSLWGDLPMGDNTSVFLRVFGKFTTGVFDLP